MYTLKQQKPQLSDHIEAWDNYEKLFDFVVSEKRPEMVITTQWASDILQEFVYHFQDFCQYRAHLNHRTEDEISRLQSDTSIWSLSKVLK
jgi:hypothetical protein